MALTPSQIAELLKLRALGWSQAEIAEQLKTSQQVIGYPGLKKLKKQSKEKGADEVFNAALIGGLAGAAAGIGIVALLELLKEPKEVKGEKMTVYDLIIDGSNLLLYGMTDRNKKTFVANLAGRKKLRYFSKRGRRALFHR